MTLYRYCLYVHTAMLINVEVVSVPSVRISWSSLQILDITGYMVSYVQTGITQSVNVTSSINSVVIDGLMNNVEYQFQVAAIAELLDGNVITGERSIHNFAFDCTLSQGSHTYFHCCSML